MRKIIISGIIGWDANAKDLRKALTEANGQPVQIEINSPGGLVYEGIEMYNLIRRYKGRTECVIMGMAASMASYIALACDKAKAMSNATYMIHNALTVAMGNHNQLRKTATQLENISQLLANAYQAKTKLPMKNIRRMMDEETFLYGSEIGEAGFVDEVIQAEPRETPDKASAVAQAQATLGAMWTAMRDSVEAQGDLQRAAAILDPAAMQAALPGIDEGEVASSDDKTFEPAGTLSGFSGITEPGVPGAKNTEVRQKMTLAELLAANPAASAEHLAMLSTARIEAETAVRTQLKATALKAVKYMEGYPRAIQALAISVLSGERGLDVLEGAAVAYEAMTEAGKSTAAQTEGGTLPETPPSDGAGAAAQKISKYEETGVVDSVEAYKAMVKEGK